MTPSLACTGSSARWCPVCGDCACGPRYEGDGADGERTLDDAGCPLHGASSTHARDTAPDLAAQVLSLADALATAERERDEARAERDTARSALDGLVAAVAKEREAHAAFDDADAAYRDAPSVPALLSLGAATDALRDATAHTDAAIAGCS